MARLKRRKTAWMGVTVGVSLGLASVWAAPTFAQQPSAPTDAEVQKTLQTCFQCHGEGGVSRLPSRPSIAGQKPDYIVRQLHAFKGAAAKARVDDDGDGDNAPSGAEPGVAGVLPVRSDPVMQHMARALPDAMIVQLARAVSLLACDGGKEQKPRKASAAPAIAVRCAVCHGADGIGVEGNVPNLAGQQRAYLRRQLLLIRETAWGAKAREGEEWRSHPIMERQAARLKIEDVDALASYYARLDCRGAPRKIPEGLATE